MFESVVHSAGPRVVRTTGIYQFTADEGRAFQEWVRVCETSNSQEISTDVTKEFDFVGVTAGE